jgi:hypothetical protein
MNTPNQNGSQSVFKKATILQGKNAATLSAMRMK